MSEGVYLPVFHHFENGNVFTGSLGEFRYKITPDVHMKTQKEVDYDASSVKAEYWRGKLSYEFSNIEGEKTFALTPDACDEMRQWLNSAALPTP
ncbi:MAG: hypothetical protein II437_03615 [Oscillospiraceae bacterium]|jgi:hypothetical protein|nr:hypothetical protein [Oscillospiraceae bacterium]